VYVLLHSLAAIRNHPVGPTRPPESKLHASCFIVAKIALVLWIVAIAPSCILVSRPDVCLKGTIDCKLLLLDVVASSSALWVPNPGGRGLG
jgi:hypothetical protein